MIISQKYRFAWSGIPLVIRTFLLKGLLLFLLWKSIYLLFLLPGRIIDSPLTRFIGTQSVNALNLFSSSHRFASEISVASSDINGLIKKEEVINILYDHDKVLEIADACNGLELIILYVGFIICLPSSVSRKLFYSVAGVISIFLLNISRCALLTLISIHKPQYLDFSHHYAFNFIVYGFIIILWILYTKDLKLNNNEKT